MLKELVQLFAQDYPQQLAALRDSLARRDAKTLTRVSHALKGCLANLAAQSSAHAAQHLELLAEKENFNDAATTLTALETEIGKLWRAVAATHLLA